MWLQRKGLTCHVCKWHKLQDAIPLGNHPSNKLEEVTKTFRPVSRWSTLYFVDGARPRVRGEGLYTYVNLSQGLYLNVHLTARLYIDRFEITWVHILNLLPTPSMAFDPCSARTPWHLFMKHPPMKHKWIAGELDLQATYGRHKHALSSKILRSLNQSLSKYMNISGLTLLGLIAFTVSIPRSTGRYLHPPAARLIWHKLHCQYRTCTKTGILESSTHSHRGNWLLWNAGRTEGAWPMWPNTCL